MSRKDLLLFVTGTSWSVLGFTRGLQSYDYTYTKSIHKEPYLYISKGQQGLLGIFLYMNPLLFPITLYKEMYRLEVNLRGLEEEKKTVYYNSIF
jgi:hypothetical protein